MIFLLFGGVAVFATGPPGVAFGGIFFLFFIVVIIIVVARATTQSGPGVQRPYTQQTAFSPPPPPDTILVKCEYCGMSQPFKEKCDCCGAPLPHPRHHLPHSKRTEPRVRP